MSETGSTVFKDIEEFTPACPCAIFEIDEPPETSSLTMATNPYPLSHVPKITAPPAGPVTGAAGEVAIPAVFVPFPKAVPMIIVPKTIPMVSPPTGNGGRIGGDDWGRVDATGFTERLMKCGFIEDRVSFLNKISLHNREIPLLCDTRVSLELPAINGYLPSTKGLQEKICRLLPL